MAHRICDRCHIRMPPYKPRVTDPNTGEKLCEGCQNGRPGRPLTGSVMKPQPMLVEAKLRRTAHGHLDGLTVMHCPFDGSGQVISNSDGTIACDFCHQSFTVLVQPSQPMMPQTVDGQPYPPGSPGEAPPPGQEGDGEGERDEKSFGGEDLSDKTPDDDQPDDGNPFAKKDDGGGDKPPPKKDDSPPKESMLITSAGIALPLDQYMAHLAMTETHDPDATIQEIKQRGI